MSFRPVSHSVGLCLAREAGARRRAASTFPRALLAAAADAPTAYGVPPCPCAVQLLTVCA